MMAKWKEMAESSEQKDRGDLSGRLAESLDAMAMDYVALLRSFRGHAGDHTDQQLRQVLHHALDERITDYCGEVRQSVGQQHGQGAGN